jgi:hypothetical protein
MASNRHLGMIIALQALYEYDFRAGLGDDSADLFAIMTQTAIQNVINISAIIA